MRILIIGPGKLKYMPYAHFYLDNINCQKNEVHLAYWNRDEKPEETSYYQGIILHEFPLFMVNDAPLKTKFRQFRRYRAFVKRILKIQPFDFIIILHSLCGLMIYDVLQRHFKGRFILDYRDSTYESQNKLFGKVVKNLCRMSRVTFVSSDSFRRFLPDDCADKIYTSHNLMEDSLQHREYQRTSSDKIRMAFWGFIRHFEINRILIDRIAADQRFELHYYGREQKDALDLKEYAKRIGASNVFFHGEYNPNERYEFVKNTDLIHNIYSGANENMAMGNKYYDSIIFRIPQVCQVNSFMGKTSVEHLVGFMANPEDAGFCDKVYNYYSSLNKDSFNKACDKELDRILSEYNLGKEIIKESTN